MRSPLPPDSLQPTHLHLCISTQCSIYNCIHYLALPAQRSKKKQHRKQFPRFRFMKNKTILKTNTNTPGPIRFKSGACVEEKKKRKTNESIVVDGRNGPEKRQTRHNATVHIWMTWKSGRNWKLTKEMHFKYTINELHEFLNGAEMHK